jgi:hypothetical protein
MVLLERSTRYCESARYANSGACFLARESYCESDSNAYTGACFASGPSYCSSSSYADAPACSGTRPAYCENSLYANSKACSRAERPSPKQIMEVARRLGAPIDVDRLMRELMK